MLKQTVRFPIKDRESVGKIERAVNKTWVLLLLKFSKSSITTYILHMEEDGKHIQQYSLDSFVGSFELVSDSKLFAPE